MTEFSGPRDRWPVEYYLLELGENEYDFLCEEFFSFETNNDKIDENISILSFEQIIQISVMGRKTYYFSLYQSFIPYYKTEDEKI